MDCRVSDHPFVGINKIFTVISTLAITSIVAITIILFTKVDTGLALFPFFPLHLLVSLVTLILFASIIYVIYRIQINNTNKLVYRNDKTIEELKKDQAIQGIDDDKNLKGLKKLMKIVKKYLPNDKWDILFNDFEKTECCLNSYLKSPNNPEHDRAVRDRDSCFAHFSEDKSGIKIIKTRTCGAN